MIKNKNSMSKFHVDTTTKLFNKNYIELLLRLNIYPKHFDPKVRLETFVTL